MNAAPTSLRHATAHGDDLRRDVRGFLGGEERDHRGNLFGKPGAVQRLVPLNRAGFPEEVAAVVAFLASEEASYVTAQIISVSGGMA